VLDSDQVGCFNSLLNDKESCYLRSTFYRAASINMSKEVVAALTKSE
jgi:hypothetical protein